MVVLVVMMDLMMEEGTAKFNPVSPCPMLFPTRIYKRHPLNKKLKEMRRKEMAGSLAKNLEYSNHRCGLRYEEDPLMLLVLEVLRTDEADFRQSEPADPELSSLESSPITTTTLLPIPDMTTARKKIWISAKNRGRNQRSK